MAPRHSGLQKQVLALYKRALRMTNTKPPLTQPKFRLFVKYHFNKNASSISSRDISTVEYLLRQGHKQVEMYENKSIRDCWLTEDMLEWARKSTSSGRKDLRTLEDVQAQSPSQSQSQAQAHS